MDLTGGLFSAVTGIRRFGDLAANNNSNNGGNNSKSSSSGLKKRSFSEVGKLGSTVAAQQFVFGSGGNSNSHLGGNEDSNLRGGDSNSGFGSRSASMGARGAGGSNSNSGGFQIPGGSLFAQLGAKRART